MDALTIDGLLAHHARYRPGAPALVCGDARRDWAALARRCAQLAAGMQAAGVAKGDRVATVLGNCAELVEIYWACAQCGAVAVPLSPLLLAPGLQSLLGDAAPKLVFHSAATEAPTRAACAALPTAPRLVLVDGAARPDGYSALLTVPETALAPVAAAPDDLYNIMYTSGTTGLPKGIMLTQRIRAHYGALLASAWRMGPSAVVLQCGALVFNGAFAMMLPAFVQGACYIVHSQFDPQAFVDTVERERVTHVMLVPAQIGAILDLPGFDPARLASLEVLLSLGAPLPLARKQSLEAQLPQRLHELYGLTEGFLTILDRADAVRKQGSVGVPPPFFQLAIRREDGSPAAIEEVGDIVGRGPLLMPGYYGRPDLTAEAIRDGWLYTGDLGKVDADGFLYLIDRKKDMIDSGGVKIYPRDIEEVAARHPDVAEAVVFGVPDPKWGETPLAVLLLKPGRSADPAALCSWINEHVAARYQRVRGVEIVAQLPRNAAGKVLKRALRAPYWADQASLL